jgi:hypothetical protein
MKSSNELSSFQAKHDTAEYAVPDQADEPSRHFLIPWRLKAESGKSLWQQGDDAGCGSVPAL